MHLSSIKYMLQETYYIEYVDLMRRCTQNLVDAIEVGKTIARFAQYFAEYNYKFVDASKMYAITVKDNEMTKDENGKPLASTKAKSISEASSQAFAYEEAKSHVANIEKMISSLRALQTALQGEFKANGMS